MNIKNQKKFSYSAKDKNGLSAAIVFFILSNILITWAFIKSIQSSDEKIDILRKDPITIILMILAGIFVYLIMLSVGWILPFVSLNYHCEYIIHDEGILIRLFILFFYWLNIPWNLIESIDELPPETHYGLQTYGIPISLIRVKHLPIFWRLINTALKLFAPLGPGLSFPVHPALEHHDEFIRLLNEKINSK